MESKEQPLKFQIDQIANDSPDLKSQGEWKKARAESLARFNAHSIFYLVPEEGKVGIAPAIFALIRGGIRTIDELTRTDHLELVQRVTSAFGRTPEQDTLDKIDLLTEKALEFVENNPLLLSRN